MDDKYMVSIIYPTKKDIQTIVVDDHSEERAKTQLEERDY